MPDLSLVSTDELIVELEKRHEALLVVQLKEIRKGTTDVTYSFYGGIVTSIGLAECAKHALMKIQEPKDKDCEEET